jgi:hypothetical protein
MKIAALWFFRLTGVAMIANGIWMEVNAYHWFFTIPAGLPNTGEPNAHFIRDVGLAYLIFGTALAWCTFNFKNRRAVFVCVAAFMAGHALGHVVEISLGILPPSHWWLDLVPVLAPGLIFAVFLFPKPWRWLTAE